MEIQTVLKELKICKCFLDQSFMGKMCSLLNMKEFEISALSDMHNFSNVAFTDLTGKVSLMVRRFQLGCFTS